MEEIHAVRTGATAGQRRHEYQVNGNETDYNYSSYRERLIRDIEARGRQEDVTEREADDRNEQGDALWHVYPS